jgi:hypothetical protein
MARYVAEIPAHRPFETVRRQIEDYLRNESFKETQRGGETVWKKGMGLITGPQFVKFGPAGNAVKLEAWIKFALLPGIYLGEIGIKGFFGAIPKRKLRHRVEEIEKIIQR